MHASEEEFLQTCDTLFPSATMPSASNPYAPPPRRLFEPLSESCDSLSFQVNAAFQSQPWYNEWQTLTSEEYYNTNMSNTFRWRKSWTRKRLFQLMNIALDDETSNQTVPATETTAVAAETTQLVDAPALPVMPRKVSIQEPAIAVNTNQQSNGDKELDLEEARKLCQIGEGKFSFSSSFLNSMNGFTHLTSIQTDDLQKMSEEDLHNLLSRLVFLSKQMQEYTAYWLDAKEQLLMDAEMHNKMIASLVQYAKQQQQQALHAAAKGGSGEFIIHFDLMLKCGTHFYVTGKQKTSAPKSKAKK